MGTDQTQTQTRTDTLKEQIAQIIYRHQSYCYTEESSNRAADLILGLPTNLTHLVNGEPRYLTVGEKLSLLDMLIRGKAFLVSQDAGSMVVSPNGNPIYDVLSLVKTLSI